MATLPVIDTWAAGEKPTAAKMNKNIRDALNFVLNPPSVKCYQNVGQNIANGTLVDVSLDTEVWDTDNVFNAGTMKIVTPGLYMIQAGAGFVPNATGFRQVSIMANGAEQSVARGLSVGSAAGTYLGTTNITRLAANDTLTLRVQQTSGGTLMLASGPSVTFLSATWVGI